MSPAERQAVEAEIIDLERKAQKRRGEPGYAANVKAVEARIAELRAKLGEGG